LEPVELTQRLVRMDTINPPGNEMQCARLLQELLDTAGFETSLIPLGTDAQRASLVARRGYAGGAAGNRPIAFTGHIDVVPLGTRRWTHPPFDAVVHDGRIHGRGTSDMKSGIAAFVCAAIAAPPEAELLLIITAGEETGCDGARVLAAGPHLGSAGALVVCEPTDNVVYVGHKGALWLRTVMEGKTAHGSMPEQGDNAICKAVAAIDRITPFDFCCDRHAVLGGPTLNVGTFHGGININSVPDRAVFELDIRTVPSMDHATVRAALAAQMNERADIEVLVDLPAVWTDPQTPWVRRVMDVASRVTGRAAEIRTATYFSDASLLGPALGHVPAIILGPGEPSMAHQTDEWCSISNIERATRIYGEMILDWIRCEQAV